MSEVNSPVVNCDLSLSIQAGGFSTRMGQDKALLPFGGMPLIQYIVHRGKTLTDDIFVTSNQVDALKFLGLPIAPDLLTQRGTLVGMHTALSAAKRPYVAVIGCDMPFFSPSLLAYQAQLLKTTGLDAVIPRSKDGLEPLHGVYRREPCLTAVTNALEMAIYSLTGWIKLLHIVEIDEEQIRPHDPTLHAFVNLNTLDDYRHALDLAGLEP